MIQNTTAVYETDTLKILDPAKIHMERKENGYLSFSYDGEEHEKVTLTRLVPYKSDDEYISVTYEKERDEWQEIGVIKDVAALPDAERQTAREYMEFKYYIPVINKIHKITDNGMGYLFLDADTNAGRKKIAVNDWWHNFRIIDNKMLSVTDADGNRYKVPEIEKLDRASVKRLQLFI